MSDLRPLAVGEIVDRSINLWRANWKPLFRLYVGFQLIQYLLLKLWQLGLKKWFPAALVTSRMTEELKNDLGGTLLRFGVSSGAILLLTLFFTQVEGVAMSAYVYPRHVGTGAPSTGEALRQSLRRLGPTTVSLLLSLAWTLLVGILWQVPAAAALGGGVVLTTRSGGSAALALLAVGAVLSVLAAVVALLWFVVRFFCLAQVAAVEPASAWQVFRRSDALSSGRVEPGFLGLVKVRLTLLITVVGLVLSVIYVVTGLPSAIVTAAYGNALDPMHSDQTAIPAALLIPAELFQVVVGSLVAPIYAVFAVVFYVDMRVRREGLDLALALDEGAKP